MKLRIYNTLFIIMGAILMNSCSKQTTDPLMDARPDVPVNITNATEYRPDPTVTTSVAAGGKIEIVLAIPENSGRTIKEITKVAASTSYSRIQAGTLTGLYVATPVAVNGTSYTFKTTLADYYAKYPGAVPANSELGNRFYFLVTLDDGTQLVTMPVRILVLA